MLPSLFEALEMAALESIFRQTVRPGRIRVHYEPDDDDISLANMTATAQSILERVQGPTPTTILTFHKAPKLGWHAATKLLGTLWLEWNNSTSPPPTSSLPSDKERPSSSAQENLIVVADDDTVLTSTWLQSLIRGHMAHPDAAIGLRGWRVRQDLVWGVPQDRGGYKQVPEGIWQSMPSGEAYVIYGHRIMNSWRVGVVTGNNGILVRPSFYNESVFSAPNEEMYTMDDIWNSGSLAARSIPRFVVPTVDSCFWPVVVKHYGQEKSVIDSQLVERGRVRARVNDLV